MEWEGDDVDVDIIDETDAGEDIVDGEEDAEKDKEKEEDEVADESAIEESEEEDADADDDEDKNEDGEIIEDVIVNVTAPSKYSEGSILKASNTPRIEIVIAPEERRPSNTLQRA